MEGLPWWSPTTGGAQRSNLLWRALRRCAPVDTLLLTHQKPSSDQVAEWRREGFVGYVLRPPNAARGPLRLVRRLSPIRIDWLSYIARSRELDYTPLPEGSRW